MRTLPYKQPFLQLVYYLPALTLSLALFLILFIRSFFLDVINTW